MTDEATHTPTLDQVIGERVHMYLFRNRLQQKDLARHTHIDASALSKKLRGERPWYAHEVLSAADYCGVSISYLYGETDEPGPPDGDPGSWLRGSGSNRRPADYLCDDVDAILLPLPVAA